MKKLTFPQNKNLVQLHTTRAEQKKSSDNAAVHTDEYQESSKKISSSRFSERRVYCLDGPGGNYSGL
jgi:hypothetical protein